MCYQIEYQPTISQSDGSGNGCGNGNGNGNSNIDGDYATVSLPLKMGVAAVIASMIGASTAS